jgi:hypothetical protein
MKSFMSLSAVAAIKQENLLLQDKSEALDLAEFTPGVC